MSHLIGTIVEGGNKTVCLQGEKREYFEKWLLLRPLCSVSLINDGFSSGRVPS